MADVLYTTTNSIRAAISVTEAELTDSVIVDLCVEDQLLVYLARNVPDHAQIQSDGTSGGVTDAQKARWRSLRLLTMYAAAVICLQSGQYLLAQTMVDGGTTMSRFGKDDLLTVVTNMETMRDYYLGIVNDDGTGVMPAPLNPLI